MTYKQRQQVLKLRRTGQPDTDKTATVAAAATTKKKGDKADKAKKGGKVAKVVTNLAQGLMIDSFLPAVPRSVKLPENAI